MKRATLYTDGGARGNPGPAGIGFVLVSEAGDELAAAGRYLGETTNNVAEYEALLAGLCAARAVGADELLVRADSELVVKQMRGEYRVKHPNLKPLFVRAQELVRGFALVRFEHVRRAENARADGLANDAMDCQGDVGTWKAEPDGASRCQQSLWEVS
ncbi:MAG TPA: ribonuclease HI family protein [Coriobacteriia bacterium]|nr:ribonuclease HI family protein [Coriobacteriia bacterium]